MYFGKNILVLQKLCFGGSRTLELGLVLFGLASVLFLWVNPGGVWLGGSSGRCLGPGSCLVDRGFFICGPRFEGRDGLVLGPRYLVRGAGTDRNSCALRHLSKFLSRLSSRPKTNARPPLSLGATPSKYASAPNMSPYIVTHEPRSEVRAPCTTRKRAQAPTHHARFESTHHEPWPEVRSCSHGANRASFVQIAVTDQKFYRPNALKSN